MLKIIVSFLISIALALPAYANNCAETFMSKKSITQFEKILGLELSKRCMRTKCKSEHIAKSISKSLTLSTKFKVTKAYAALIGIMVSTSAVTVSMSSLMGTNYPHLAQFLTIFVGQVTTLGVFIAGAPIWEPLASKVREKAFQMLRENQETTAFSSKSDLEEQFFRTNGEISTNAQWARSVLRDYTQILLENFYHTRQNLNNGENLNDISSQVLEITKRLVNLYPDVDPASDLIVNAVRKGFTQYLKDPKEVAHRVTELIRMNNEDPHLIKIVQTWLSSQ